MVGCAFLAMFAFVMAFVTLADLDLDLDFAFDGGASEAELAAAATTIPPSPADCVALNQLLDIAAATARVNFDADTLRHDFATYRTRVDFHLAVFAGPGCKQRSTPRRDRCGRTSPMRATPSLEASTSSDAHRLESTTTRSRAARGYTELEIADELLGPTCGGRLSVPSDEALRYSTEQTPVSAGAP